MFNFSLNDRIISPSDTANYHENLFEVNVYKLEIHPAVLMCSLYKFIMFSKLFTNCYLYINVLLSITAVLSTKLWFVRNQYPLE